MSWTICIIARPSSVPPEREVFEHLDVGSGRQCPVRFVRGGAAEVVEAVGEHADLDAGAVDAQSALIQGHLNLSRRRTRGADASVSDRRF